ncbi:MAG: stage V sporulation protein AE [Clostridiales bacterium]|nr:stage V sporulation protein AE [Clostridiales bacterium]
MNKPLVNANNIAGDLYDFLKAFIIGGLICVIGQLLIDLTKMTPARILVTFVCLGVVLGAFGVYDKLVDFAGAGATIPLTGFGNSLANGVKEAVKENGFTGIITGGLSACAGGVTVAVLSGLVVSLISKPKDKG